MAVTSVKIGGKKATKRDGVFTTRDEPSRSSREIRRRLDEERGTDSTKTTTSKSRVAKPIKLDVKDVVTQAGETSSEISGQDPIPLTSQGVLSRLREEDSVLGAAVRVATDWRTTVALTAAATTLSLTTISPGAIGAAAATKTSTSGLVSIGSSSFNRLGLTKLTGTAGKVVAGKFVGVSAGKGIATGIATNPKTIALTTSLLTKAGMFVGAAAIVGTVAGTFPFEKFEMAEATDKIGIAMFNAAQAGDWEEVLRLKEYFDNMLDATIWEKVLAKIPFANVFQSATKNIAAAVRSSETFVKIAEDTLLQQQNGETETDKWERINQERKDSELEVTDYYNEQRRIMIEFENEARAAQRQDDAMFWARQREQQREAERLDREAIALFWQEYRKNAIKAQENQRPSNLNFGLL